MENLMTLSHHMLHACMHAAWHMDDETLGYGLPFIEDT
jgi:hypothetical protein